MDIVDSYTIFASISYGCSNIADQRFNINGSLMEYNLTSLEEFTNYSISIMASNHRGSSSNFTVYQQTKSKSKSPRIIFLQTNVFIYLVCCCLI